MAICPGVTVNKYSTEKVLFNDYLLGNSDPNTSSK